MRERFQTPWSLFRHCRSKLRAWWVWEFSHTYKTPSHTDEPIVLGQGELNDTINIDIETEYASVNGIQITVIFLKHVQMHIKNFACLFSLFYLLHTDELN